MFTVETKTREGWHELHSYTAPGRAYQAAREYRRTHGKARIIHHGTQIAEYC